MAEAIVLIVVGRITDLLNEEAQVLHGVQEDIQKLVTKLMRMKTFLRDADSRISEHNVRNLVADIRELAYDAEHVVETFFLKASSSGERKRTRQAIKYSKKIEDIEKKMSPIFDFFGDYKIRSTLESPGSSNSSYGKLQRFFSYATVEPERFVGFQEDVDRLVGHLVNESDDCYRLISICGMGGLGKTTLAKKIYTHSTIKTYFAGLAWVSISQKWQAKDVLQRILICLVPEKRNEILTSDSDKLVENMLQIQQSKNCLIVLDDIWSVDAWDSLKSAFPAEKSRSRLMLTSRNDNVAEHANPNGLIHRPVLLTPEQSWELLQLKALPKGGDCLDITRDVKRMEELGREMVGKCGGLPLAIEMLGGILVTKPSLIEWEKVYTDSLSSLKSGEGFGEKYQNQIFDVLVWSYKDLPPQLKPCFLYLGKYSEDESIDAETLYQLWIAEGIVLSSDKREGETMMQVAESYMGELVHRSMVQVRLNDLESSLTKFESCSLHDLMRDLSISQAKAEDFSEAIYLPESNDSVTSLSANTRQLVVYIQGNYRGKKANSYFIKKPHHQKHRSILLINVATDGSLQLQLGSYFANFKLLRVLALENIDHRRQSVLGTLFGTNIGRVLGSLVYLRYLSLRHSKVMTLMTFPWIQKLVMLQTLKLDTYCSTDDITPVSSNFLSKLAHLRHLCLPVYDFGESGKNIKLQFNGLSKLETLVNFDTRWCEVKDLPKLSSLRKLKLIAEGNNDDLKEMLKYLSGIASSSTSCLQYLALDIYHKFIYDRDMIRQLLWDNKSILQELRIHGKLPELADLFEQQQQQQVNNTHIDSSWSLIRITMLILNGSYLEKDPMPVLEKIPTLRELVLSRSAYVGKEMVCSAMGFPKLTWFRLYDLPNLVKWRVEEGSMPILECLKIVNCPELEEVPEGLIFLKSLRKLVLYMMPSVFCDRIRLENEEQGPEFHKVAHVPHLVVERR